MRVESIVRSRDVGLSQESRGVEISLLTAHIESLSIASSSHKSDWSSTEYHRH